MLSEFQRFIKQHRLFAPEEVILLAVSGGIDSMVMEELFHRAGFQYAIAHCNFSLRDDESDSEEALVRDLASKRQVIFHVAKFDTREYARKQRISVQMAARELRYAWFRELVQKHGYAATATAHHQDDQAETFLINVIRGTGIAGLHGILPRSEGLVRPMLFTRRNAIVDFAGREHIRYLEDSSNRQVKYQRNQIRHRIIPLLEKLNPSFTAELTGTITRIREAEQIYLQVLAEKRKTLVSNENGLITIPIRDLKRLAPLAAWLYELLIPYGYNRSTTESIISALDGQPGKVFISASHILVVDREKLLIQALSSHETGGRFLLPIETREGEWEGPLKIRWKTIAAEGFSIPDSPRMACFDKSALNKSLSVRKWERGDFFFPLGMNQRKKLSDFFVDLHLSLPAKKSVHLLCHGEDIAWVIGYRLDDRFKVVPSTKEILCMEWC